MEKRYITLILIPILLSCFTGCASIYSRGWHKDELYPGVSQDLKSIAVSTSGGRSFAMDSLIDLPFSFALDTILLPFDAFSYFKEGRYRRKPIKKRTTEPADINITSSGNETIQSGQ